MQCKAQVLSGIIRCIIREPIYYNSSAPRIDSQVERTYNTHMVTCAQHFCYIPSLVVRCCCRAFFEAAKLLDD